MVREVQAGTRSSLRAAALAAALTMAGASALAGCSDGPNPFQAASSTTAAGAPAGTAPAGTSPAGTVTVGTATDGTSTDGVGENAFIPDRNLSDCVGALERPNCGSKEKGGLGTYLVFLALILGVGFIMWRVARGVKARDAVMNTPKVPAATAASANDDGAGERGATD